MSEITLHDIASVSAIWLVDKPFRWHLTSIFGKKTVNAFWGCMERTHGIAESQASTCWMRCVQKLSEIRRLSLIRFDREWGCPGGLKIELNLYLLPERSQGPPGVECGETRILRMVVCLFIDRRHKTSLLRAAEISWIYGQRIALEIRLLNTTHWDRFALMSCYSNGMEISSAEFLKLYKCISYVLNIACLLPTAQEM